MGAGASKRRFHVGFKPRCSAFLGASCAVGVTECPRWVCSQGEASYRPQHSMARASSALEVHRVCLSVQNLYCYQPAINNRVQYNVSSRKQHKCSF